MKKIITILILLFHCSILLSQYDINGVKTDSTQKKSRNKLHNVLENTFVGSALNLSLGNTTFIFVAPHVGYDITPKFAFGVQSLYQYYRATFSTGFYSANSIGIGLFFKYRPIENLSLETSINVYSTEDIVDNKVNSKSWLIGASYNRSIGDKAYSYFSLYYNFIKDPFVPEPILFSFNDFALYYKFGITLYPFNFN